ncbi:MAG: mechanosensitive ion channel family protein, partial [Lachnospiraceae bacterium]|nr:mechanosensitive ion channel family protein [Lachnospiraceae bacterium]
KGKELFYYAAKIDEDREAVIEINPKEYYDIVKSSISWEKIIDNINSNSDITTFVVSRNNYQIYYADIDNKEDILGKNALAYGFSSDLFLDGQSTFFKVKDQIYFGSTRYVKSQNVYLILAVTNDIFVRKIVQSLHPCLFSIFVLIILITGYVVCIVKERSSNIDEERDSQLKGTWRQLAVLSICGSIAIMIMTGFLNILTFQYEQADSDSYKADHIINTITENETTLDNYEKEYNSRFVTIAKTASTILSRKPELRNKTDMKQLSNALNIEYMVVYNMDGKQVETDSDLKDTSINTKNENDRSYDFSRILHGVDFYIQQPMENELTTQYDQKIGIRLFDKEGKQDGVLILTVLPSKYRKSTTSLKTTNTLRRFNASMNMLIAINRDTDKIFYASDESMIKMDPNEVGIPDSKIYNNYIGYVNVFDQKYYGKCAMNDKYAVFYLTEADYGTDVIYITLFIYGIFIFFFITCLLFPFLYFKVVLAEKPKNIKIKIYETKQATSEENFSTLFKTIYLIIGVSLIILYLINKDRLFIIKYIVENNWEKGLTNIAIAKCFIIIVFNTTIETIISSLLKYIAKSMNSKNATICRLLQSLTKYATLMMTLYICLTEIGVRPGTLLASAGILTAVIGFGAQSLMTDLLAGLFIIFEGSYRVGEIVFDSSGFRGMVTDIGLRTTKLKDDDQNVKIVNNSEMRNIINASNFVSLATCDFQLHSYVEFDKVEETIKKEMIHFSEKIPQILDMEFRNLIGVNQDFITIRVVAFCHEIDRPPVERALYAQLRRVCEKYDFIETYSNIMIVNEKCENVINSQLFSQTKKS